MLAEGIAEIPGCDRYFLITGHNLIISLSQLPHFDGCIDSCLLELLRRHVGIFDASPVHELHTANANRLANVIHSSGCGSCILTRNGCPVRNTHHCINARIKIDAGRCKLTDVVCHVRHVVTGFIRKPVQFVEFFLNLISHLAGCRHNGFGRSYDRFILRKTFTNLVDAEGFCNARRIGGDLARHCSQCGSCHRFKRIESSSRCLQGRIKAGKTDA